MAMTVEPRAAIAAFSAAKNDLQVLSGQSSIGSKYVLDGIQSAVRNFGQGVEGLWTQTARAPDSVPSEAAHDVLIDLKNLGVFEGAARVAYQRTGSMDIPYEQTQTLRAAAEHAGSAMNLLAKAPTNVG